MNKGITGFKLLSRPEDYVAGSGPYAVRLEYDQVQLIAALLYNIRLGDDQYKLAAFELMNTIEEMFDEDFCQEAADDVDLEISIIDANHDIIETYNNANICIEV